MKEELSLLKRKLERERKARKAAERILEERALQLYESNEKLLELNSNLEIKAELRARELVKLIKNEEKYRRIIENMELGLLEVDRDQKIIKAYDWFCDMTGYREAELIGKNATEIFLTEFRHKQQVLKQHEKREQGQAGIYEVQLKHKQGHLFWVMISASPIFDNDGRVCGSIGIHYDISRQKKLQKALLDAKRTAENAQKAEQLFLARMSHEIRTPLNAIIGMSHLLKGTNPSEEQQDYLNILSDSSDILKLLISDVLDYSKIQSGEISIQKSEFNLHTLIASLQKTIQSQVKSNTVTVTSNVDEGLDHMLIGDPLLLNQILINLLNNARKFTYEGNIHLGVKCVTETKEKICLRFEVKDTGIGISPEKLESIFENFKQAENGTKEELNGTGLGLAISKQIVELQGGTIELASVLDEGSAFSFQLIYEKGSLAEKDIQMKTKEFVSNSFNRQKLLIVEDNYMNRKYILTLLSKWNLEYEVAEDGKIAVEKANNQKFELIFMDISMPNMNGYQATEHIRKSRGPNAETPIIGLSASAITTNIEKAKEKGMTNFLCKPFDPQNLHMIISQYLNSVNDSKTEQNLRTKSIFKPPIDSQTINDLYQRDWAMGSTMFATFIENSLPQFSNFSKLILEEDHKGIENLAHKLASNLNMVGLTELQEILIKVEDLSRKGTDIALISKNLNTVLNRLRKTEPILRNTLNEINKLHSTSLAK